MSTIVQHRGFISYQLATDTLVESYTTTANNEIINFSNSYGKYVLNSLLIENTGTTTMWVKPIESDYALCIPAGESRIIDYIDITGIQILGNSGQTLRWSGCWY